MGVEKDAGLGGKRGDACLPGVPLWAPEAVWWLHQVTAAWDHNETLDLCWRRGAEMWSGLPLPAASSLGWTCKGFPTGLSQKQHRVTREEEGPSKQKVQSILRWPSSQLGLQITY